MTTLARLLRDKLKADGLTPAQAARTMGVAAPSLTRILAGTSMPNQRSVERYAAFLGLPAARILELKPTSRRPQAPPRATRRAPGRTPGPRSRDQEAVGAALARIANFIVAAEALCADDLAQQVHQLDKRTRAKIAALIP